MTTESEPLGQTSFEHILQQHGWMLLSLLDGIGDGLVVANRVGQLVFFNEAAKRHFGGMPSDTPAVEWMERVRCFRSDGVTPYLVSERPLALALRGEEVDNAELLVRQAESRGDLWLSVTARPLQDEAGEIRGAVAIYRDITEHKRAEEADRHSKARNAAMLESALDAILMIDHERTILEFNPAAESVFGYSRAEVLGRPLAEVIIPVHLREAHFRGLACYVATGSGPLLGRRVEMPALRADGSEFLAELVITPIWTTGLPTFMGVLRDVTERTQAELKIKHALVQSRALTSHLQNLREEERSHIAREIHDELGQVLTGLKMDLAWLNHRLAEGSLGTSLALLVDKVQDMSSLLDSTIQSVRRLATELRPGILDHLGLAAAVEWQAEDFEKHSGIRCTVVCTLAEVSLDKARTTAAFRILQESLTNVARHAAATAITIRLTQEADCFMLEVADNGCGIKDGDLSARHSLGLLGMRERAALLGGEVQIARAPGQGTKITARIPLKPHTNSNCTN